MKYSKYFGYITRDNGQPQLSIVQFQRMMNIVSLEGTIHGLQIIKEKLKETSEYYKYDSDIFKYEKTLHGLTKDLKQEDLLKEMIEISQD